MISSKKGVQDFVSLFKQKGIKKIIITPGSRNAPLTISFTQDHFFTCFSIPDERSAAFYALGMAQYDKHPVAIVCTSGSALLNFYPAVAEAYYQKTPMIVISADRPREWIDQADGQTIRQENALDKHSKLSVNLLQEVDTEKDRLFNQRLINEAINAAINGRKGPVHINFPFEEPLYEQTEVPSSTAKNIKVHSTQNELTISALSELSSIWNKYSRRMILAGVLSPNEELNTLLGTIANQAIVFTETTSNLHHPDFFPNIDRTIRGLSEDEEKELQPDILITIGGPIVSKNIKHILRKYRPTYHWHINPDDLHLDTYQCLTDSIPIEPGIFLQQLTQSISNESNNDYFEQWKNKADKKKEKHQQWTKTAPWSDHLVFNSINKTIPANYVIHLANSSPVRYAQLYDWHKDIHFFCNRGTSGIDGSSSTAAGYALASEKNTCLITGDISFFYDSNALWNHHLPSNLKIILINNNGGNIFRFIPGPSNTGALEKFFETTHNFNGKGLSETFNLNYSKVSSINELDEVLPEFFAEANGKASILEVCTPRLDNSEVLRDYFKALKLK